MASAPYWVPPSDQSNVRRYIPYNKFRCFSDQQCTSLEDERFKAKLKDHFLLQHLMRSTKAVNEKSVESTKNDVPELVNPPEQLMEAPCLEGSEQEDGQPNLVTSDAAASTTQTTAGSAEESPCSTVGHEVVCAPVTAPDDNLVERGSVGSPHHSVDTSSSDDDLDCSCYADDGSVLPFGSFLLYTDNGKRHTFRVQCPDGRYIRVPTLGENCSAETALKLSENFEQALYSEMLSAALADNIDVASSLVVGNHFIAEDRSMEESSDSSICLSPAKKDRAAGSMTGYDSETMMDDGSGGRECCSNESDMDMAEVESNKRKGHSSAEPLHSSDDEVSSGNKSDSSEGYSGMESDPEYEPGIPPPRWSGRLRRGTSQVTNGPIRGPGRPKRASSGNRTGSSPEIVAHKVIKKVSMYRMRDACEWLEEGSVPEDLVKAFWSRSNNSSLSSSGSVPRRRRKRVRKWEDASKYRARKSARGAAKVLDIPSIVNDDGTQAWYVEKILKRRMGANGVHEYFVKWQFCSAEENSWEPECNLDCPQLMEKFKEEHGYRSSSEAEEE